MTPFDDLPRERWELIDRIFQESLELSPEERGPLLDRECEGDTVLRATVEGLLAAVDSGATRIGTGALTIDEALISEMEKRLAPDSLKPGASVGPYRLVRELGRGGTGTVFLAQRDDGTYRQEVALKVLRRGLDTDDVLARFRVERQILASLEHPNISRLLDGGATDDGRPYIVMEAIEGEPITTYAKRRKLGLRDRLHLFLVVTDALRYAHQHLVVHRDLKPSNILVAPDGRLKLLDFGIAKLLDTRTIPGGSPATRTEVRLLTPEYATPEQLRGEPVTTATDVYQLGILLYELLTGRHPHAVAAKSVAARERAICETTPPLPSRALRELLRRKAEGMTPGAGRAVPDGVSSASPLRGDLDRIVMKALEKDPTRRYPSVEQLAEDVQSYLDGRPVRARGAGIGYVTGKFVRRNPAAFGAGALAVAVTGALILTLMGNAERLGAERDRAEVAAARAESVSDFLVELFSLTEFDEGRGDTVSARGVLDRGAERLLDDPGALEATLRADMLQVLGRAYVGLGFGDAARSVLETSLSLREGGGPLDPVAAARAHVLLAAVHRERRDVAAAEPHFAYAVSLLEAMDDPPGVLLADALHGLALSLRADPTMLDSAVVVARRGLAIRARAQGTDHPAYANALGALSAITRDPADQEAAVASYQAALERLRGDPEGRQGVASTANNLGYMLLRMGRHGEAEALFREALEVSRELEGDAHPRTALAMSQLGQLLTDLGRHEEARQILEERLDTERLARGPDHWRTAAAAEGLGRFHQRTGAPDSAYTWLRAAHLGFLQALGPDDPRTHAAARSIQALCAEWRCPGSD